MQWEDEEKKGLTLNTRALNIIWGGEGSKGRYWKRLSDGQSESVELVGVYWLEVTGNVPLDLLTPNTKYKLFVTLQLISASFNWDKCPVTFNIQLPRNIRNTTEVEFSEHLDSGWVDVPHEGLEFYVPEDNSGMLAFSIYEIEGEQWKKGLVIKEVKLVPEINLRTII